MKILHTSDWHLGHRLHEQSQYEEQVLFLKWLKESLSTNEVDVLLVAGDVFDTGSPSPQSLKLYYDFLVSLQATSCRHVVVTGGNHDAAGTINAPKELLKALSVHVVGKASDEVAEEVFVLQVDDEELIVAAVPYLRDQDIRRALAGESFENLGDRYKMALVNHYAEVATYCASIKKVNTPVIAMGHLFAVGGSTSDSEQSIYVGNLGDIGAADFPASFAYVALGHLHRPQRVGGQNHIRYSGSPTILSFSEVLYQKQVVLLQTNGDKVSAITEVTIPTFRKLYRVAGSLDSCLSQLNVIHQTTHGLIPWCEVLIDNDSMTPLGFDEVTKVAEDFNLLVLKVSLKNRRATEGLERLLEQSTPIKELHPLEVFKLKCEEQNFNLAENVSVMDAFNEALQIAQDN